MTANDAILLVSIVVPLTILAILIFVFFRHWKDDPDEQRWKRLAEERKAQASESSNDA